MPPVTLYDSHGRPIRSAATRRRRPAGGYSGSGGGDSMIPQARQNQDRKRVPLLDQDLHRNLSNYGRRTLLSLGRHIYFSAPAVKGAVEDLAADVAGCYQFESRSTAADWKRAAETLLHRHDKFCDVSGPPRNARTWRKGIIRAILRDGDVGTIWVMGDDGVPYLQVVPGHRIGSDREEVEGGPFDGARIIEGVIVDGTNRALAYRVLTGDGCSYDEFVDVPAHQMRLHFLPIFPDQVRGLSVLGLTAWHMQDLSESQRWELLAQKGAASRVFMEFNEDGEPPLGADHIVSPETGATTSDTPSGLWREVIDGGINSYFKANSGSRLEAVKFDRPSRNQQDFVAQVWREALNGAQLSVDFHLDLTKLGGAPLRLLCEKINRRHDDLREEVLEPAVRAWDFFRLGAFINSKRLPEVEDWDNWEYLPGADYTPDRRYDSDVTAQNVRIGITTRARAAAKFGEALDDIRATREAEADDLFARASRLHAKHPAIPLELILARLENDHASSPTISVNSSKTEVDTDTADPQDRESSRPQPQRSDDEEP